MFHAVLPYAPFAEPGETWHPPSLTDEFFPAGFLFVGTPFEINRIMMVRLIAVLVLVVLLWWATRRLRVVPTRGQNLVEMVFGFVRTNIAVDVLGERDAKRFMPLLTTIFLLVLATNITAVIPGLNIGSTAVIGLPLTLALVTFVVFNGAGIKAHGLGGYFRGALFPPGVNPFIYIILTPIEFLSTFVIRPLSLTLRLTMNMLVGHLLLVICFSATNFFFFAGGLDAIFRPLGAGTLLFGLIFTLFEVLVSALQAYIFTLLTAVYIQLAVAEEH